MSHAVVLDVSGMSCASCQAHVKEALAHVNGVASADVNLLTGEATVSLANEEASAVAALIGAVRDAGYDARVRPEGAEASTSARETPHLVAKAVVSLSLAALSMIAMMMHVPYAHAFGLAAALVTMAWAARHVYVRAWASVRRLSPDMSTLVALGTVASLAARYDDSVTAILGFVLLGQALEARAKRATTRSLGDLAAKMPAIVHRVKKGDGAIEEDVPYERILVGDLVRVRPGERVPVDGIVTSGTCEVDEAMLTGEPLPIAKAEGAAITGGTVLVTGSVVLSVTRAAAETTLAKILRALRDAQRSRADVQRIADAVSRVFVPVVLVLALATFAGWKLAGAEASFAIERAVAVLVIACPCAMGLAVPAAVMVVTGRAAELGVLFKGGETIERAASITHVVLDKTGTLTEGKPAVTNVVVANGAALTEDALLAEAASLELPSEHPIGRAIVREAERRGLTLAQPSSFVMTPGLGAEGVVSGAQIAAGNAALLTKLRIDPAPLAQPAKEAAGATCVYVAHKGELAGAVFLIDSPREDAAAAIARLRAMHLHLSLLTGDREGPARALAEKLGITDVVAGATPESKLAHVESLVREGKRVAMVGDGINDAAALAAATLGVAVGSGADLATDAADVTLLSPSPLALPIALGLARRAVWTMRGNLAWAAIYNVLGIPIAAGLFASRGFVLTPAIAALAMAMSSVSVLFWSLSLRWAERGGKR